MGQRVVQDIWRKSKRHHIWTDRSNCFYRDSVLPISLKNIGHKKPRLVLDMGRIFSYHSLISNRDKAIRFEMNMGKYAYIMKRMRRRWSKPKT